MRTTDEVWGIEKDGKYWGSEYDDGHYGYVSADTHFIETDEKEKAVSLSDKNPERYVMPKDKNEVKGARMLKLTIKIEYELSED